MAIKGQDTSRNPENKKQYNRVVYWCKKDYIWISIETPKKI